MYAECQSIIVNAAVSEVYHRWPRFEDLPKFTTALRNVERIDDTHFAFTSSLDGRDQEYVLRVVLRIPERRIAWHAVSENFSIGVVQFEPLSSQRTQVTVKIRSAIDPSRLGESLHECLSNFKKFVEQPGASNPKEGAVTVS